MSGPVDRTIGGSGVFLARRPSSRSDEDRFAHQLLRRGDAVVPLTFLLVLLIAIPARLAFRTLGAAGNPALLLGMLMFVWYIAIRLVPWQRPPLAGGRVRTFITLFGLSVLASYIAGMTRPIAGEEVRSADRGMLIVAAAMGVALVTMDGVPDRARLDVLIKRLCTAGAVEASIGLAQFYLGFDVTRFIKIPGLSSGGAGLNLIEGRNGLVRVAGTASHPIEFGVVLAMILPIAFHYAIFAPVGRRRGAWTKVLLIGLTVPMSVSRSAIIVLAVAMIVLIPTWSRSLRRRALLVAPLCVGAITIASPGAIRTIYNLFAHIGTDDSAAGRTADYPSASRYIHDAPWFGRGFQTFLPDKYRILDNAYLGHLIEAGLVGLAILFLLLLGTYAKARSLRRHSNDAETRDLLQTLAASLLGAFVTFVTFDALGYSMVLITTFLVIGFIGALGRLEALRVQDAGVPGRQPSWVSLPHPGVWTMPSLAVRRWYVTVAVAAVAALVGLQVRGTHGAFQATAVLTVLPGNNLVANPYDGFNFSNQTVAQIVSQQVAGRDIVVDLTTRGKKAQYTVAADFTNTPENPGTPAAPSVIVTVWSSDSAVSVAKMRQLVTTVENELNGIQVSAAPTSTERLQVVPSSLPSQATLVTGSRTRATAATLLLAGLCLMFLLALTERLAFRIRRLRATDPRPGPPSDRSEIDRSHSDGVV